MNEVLNTVPAGAVTVVGHLVAFGLGWAGALWYRRNPTKAQAIKVLVADKVAAAEVLASAAGDEAEALLHKARVKLDL